MSSTDQQQAILDAALGLLAAGGPEALRVRAIADAAGCTTMTVYSRFGGKDGVVEAIYLDGYTRFAAALKAVAVGPAGEQLRELAVAYRDWALANPGSYKVMFTEAVPGFSPSDGAALVAFEAYQVLVDAVDAVQQGGQLLGTAAVDTGWTLWGVTHGLVMLELAGIEPVESSSEAEAVYTHAIDAILRGLDPTL